MRNSGFTSWSYNYFVVPKKLQEKSTHAYLTRKGQSVGLWLCSCHSQIGEARTRFGVTYMCPVRVPFTNHE